MAKLFSHSHSVVAIDDIKCSIMYVYVSLYVCGLQSIIAELYYYSLEEVIINCMCILNWCYNYFLV